MFYPKKISLIRSYIPSRIFIHTPLKPFFKILKTPMRSPPKLTKNRPKCSGNDLRLRR